MTFFQAIDCMKHNIPVRHAGMKSGEFIMIKNGEFVRFNCTTAYGYPYRSSLSDYNVEWEPISEESINEAVLELETSLSDDKTFFESVCMMHQGFAFKMREDASDSIYAIENHKLVKLGISDAGSTVAIEKVLPSRKHYEGTWFAIGFLGKV